VKLGGVILTGGEGKAYTIASSLTGPEGANEGKVVLADAPTADYELEVRAIQIGSSAVPTVGTLVVPLMEAAYIGAAIDGLTNLNLNTQQVYLFNTAATADFTLNLRADGSNTLNGLLNTGNSVSATVILREGASVKNLTEVKIDGVVRTVQWQNNNSAMTADKLNVISLTVIKTYSDTYTVLGSITTVGA
jgi:hypothetical protein